MSESFVIPAPGTRTPQRLGKHGLVFGKQRRLDADTKTATDFIIAKTAGQGQPRASDFLAKAHTHLGYRYSTGQSRCTGTGGYHDCSGFVCWASNAVGNPFPCTNSFAIAIMGRQQGLLISEDEAIHTPGAIGIRGPHGGEGPSNGPNGSNGHIVIFDGDGKLTDEAMGHAYGVRHGRATGRGFVRWMHLPGLDYSQAQPVPEDEDVIIIICPNKPVTPDGNVPHAQFVPSSNPFFPKGGLILRWGASIANDHPTGDPHVRVIGPTGDGSWVGAVSRKDGRGIMVVNDSGHTSHPTSLPWS